MKMRSPHCHRARLRHRVFFALIASIFIAMVIAGTTVHSFGERGTQTFAFREFAEEQFLNVWSDPVRLATLVSSVERHFPVRLRLLDGAGRSLDGSRSLLACKGRVERMHITRGGTRIGTVESCIDTHDGPHLLMLLLGSLLLLLWGFSGLFARWLVRPLDELVRVAREIGDGNLAARMRLRTCEGQGHRGRIHGEVEAVALAVNQMAEKIERQIAGQRELLAAVSHEIRSPLARLRMLVELSREMPGDITRFDAMETELSEMDSLIGQLLAQSRIEFQGLERRVIGAVELARVALSRANCSVEVLEDRALGAKVEVDAGLFGRVLLNLIENAKKHGGGLVALRVKKVERTTVFEVVDHGAGFEAEALKSAFVPFVGGSKEGGLGLGLSLVKRIADAHGATVDVRSTPQQETAVSVSVACTDAIE